MCLSFIILDLVLNATGANNSAQVSASPRERPYRAWTDAESSHAIEDEWSACKLGNSWAQLHKQILIGRGLRLAGLIYIIVGYNH